MGARPLTKRLLESICDIDSVMFHSHKKTGEKLPVSSVKDRYEPIAQQQCRIFVA